jgi:2,4-diketo-3-deoxy-L-fuconate hydrolase
MRRRWTGSAVPGVPVYARVALARAALPGGRLEAAAVVDGRLYPLRSVGYERVVDVLREVEPGEFEGLARRAVRLHRGYPLGAFYLAAPLEGPGKLLGLGLNYAAHARETGRSPPRVPDVFSLTWNSVVGPEDPILVPGPWARVDLEVELAVVIGRGGRGLTPREALDAVWGYTVGDDVSARYEQFGVGVSQFWRAKSWDTFTPLGPVIVPRTHLDPRAGLRLWSRLNGRPMQDSTTSDMVHGVAEVVSYASESAWLEAGDVLLTGTPEGVGHARRPPVYLRHGDVVEACVEGVGCLRNRVVEDPATARTAPRG